MALPSPARGGRAETTAMDRAVLHNPVVVVLLGLVLRCSVGLHPHAGQGRAPAYGAFEEERHFMTVAVKVPVEEWYGDAEARCPAPRPFWGEGCLRHPPLAAYTSLAFGEVASALVPGLVDLGDTSRGFENQDARAFMRATVLICDVVFVFSAAWQFCLLYYRPRALARAPGAALRPALDSDGSLQGRPEKKRLGALKDLEDVDKVNIDDEEEDDDDEEEEEDGEMVPAATESAHGDTANEVDSGADSFVLYSRAPSSLRQRKSMCADSPRSSAAAAAAAAATKMGLGPRKTSLAAAPAASGASAAPVALVSEVFLIILLQPAFVLVDHGYFQFSGIHVGLAMWALVLCGQRRPHLALAMLCLSLNYNQVTYHFAPPVLIYLLAQRRGRPALERAAYALSLAGAGALVFGVMWAPFCAQAHDATECAYMVRRIVKRVAALRQDSALSPALWSVLPPLTQLASELPAAWARGAGVVTTVLGLAPSCVDLVRHQAAPGIRRLVWALFNCSLTFVLLATRVDRLAVLLPLMPAALLVGEAPGPSCWFSVMAVFTLSPLLASEGLGLAYVVSTSVFVGTCAICFRGEIFYLPLPWIARSGSGDLRGIRHGIGMLDATPYLRGASLAALAIHVLAATSSATGGPGLERAFWLKVHHGFSCSFLCLAWAYGNWYQWMLPDELPCATVRAGKPPSGDAKDD